MRVDGPVDSVSRRERASCEREVQDRTRSCGPGRHQSNRFFLNARQITIAAQDRSNRIGRRVYASCDGPGSRCSEWLIGLGFFQFSSNFLNPARHFSVHCARDMSVGNHSPGDDERAAAFESEALPHMDDLYRAAVRLVFEPAKAADAVQETYLVAWKSFERYERNTNCKAWLFQILFNVVRKERRGWMKWLVGTEQDLADQDLVAPEPIPSSLTDGDILSALDKVPEDFRKVLLLVDVEEFSYQEVSSILKIPMGTVMSRLSRGRKLLRAHLQLRPAVAAFRPGSVPAV